MDWPQCLWKCPTVGHYIHILCVRMTTAVIILLAGIHFKITNNKVCRLFYLLGVNTKYASDRNSVSIIDRCWNLIKYFLVILCEGMWIKSALSSGLFVTLTSPAQHFMSWLKAIGVMLRMENKIACKAQLTPSSSSSSSHWSTALEQLPSRYWEASSRRPYFEYHKLFRSCDVWVNWSLNNCT